MVHPCRGILERLRKRTPSKRHNKIPNFVLFIQKNLSVNIPKLVFCNKYTKYNIVMCCTKSIIYNTGKKIMCHCYKIKQSH